MANDPSLMPDVATPALEPGPRLCTFVVRLRATDATSSSASDSIDDDAELCARVAEGSDEAFRALVERHQHRVFTFCLKILRDRSEAEDVAQDVFLALFHHAAAFRAESRFKTWLLKIARNHALNRLKHLNRRGRNTSQSLDTMRDDQMQDGMQGGVEAPDISLEAKERIALIRRAIDELGVEQRMVLVLRHVEEMSYEEIAEVTGLPLGTVKSRIHRGRTMLVEKLARLFR